VLGVGVRHIHRHILEPSLGLLFVHRVRERGALRADRCRNSLRSPLLRRLVLYGVGIDKPGFLVLFHYPTTATIDADVTTRLALARARPCSPHRAAV
jgi:hypothetical protein